MAAWTQRKYFVIDRIGAAEERNELPGYDQPFFNGPRLGIVKMKQQTADPERYNEIYVSEREQLAGLLNNDASQRKGDQSKACLYSAGVSLQMFNISARQYDDFIGHLRQMLATIDNTTYPRYLVEGQKIFQLGVRSTEIRAIQRHMLNNLEKTHLWLWPQDVDRRGEFVTWQTAWWQKVFSEENRDIGDRFQTIEDDFYARADQISKFGWDHAEMGKYTLNTVLDAQGFATDFQLVDKSHLVRTPKIPPRAALEHLSLRIIIDIETTDKHLGDVAPEDLERATGPDFPSSVSLPIAELGEQDVRGVPREDHLAKLKRMLEVDLNINFTRDGFTLAWRNPRNFWGMRDRLVRLRSTEEMLRVLEALRTVQASKPRDKAVATHLVSLRSENLVPESEHPEWPNGWFHGIVLDKKGLKARPGLHVYEEVEGAGNVGAGVEGASAGGTPGRTPRGKRVMMQESGFGTPRKRGGASKLMGSNVRR